MGTLSVAKIRKNKQVVVTKVGELENPDLGLTEGLIGVVIGRTEEYCRIDKRMYPEYLIRFPHGSFFLLREHIDLYDGD